MDIIVKGREKKNIVGKTWERWRSFGRRHLKSLSLPVSLLKKSKSWHGTTRTSSSTSDQDDKHKTKCQIAPEGCFTVYVGPEKQRFVMKTEYANHPLFKMLLEHAELEYGFNSEGPIWLPCDVELFYEVLAEMDSIETLPGCGFAYGSCSPFNPTRRLGNSSMAKGWGSYSPLTPSRLIKMNQF